MTIDSIAIAYGDNTVKLGTHKQGDNTVVFRTDMTKKEMVSVIEHLDKVIVYLQDCIVNEFTEGDDHG